MQHMIDDLQASKKGKPEVLDRLAGLLEKKKKGIHLQIAELFRQYKREDQFASFIKSELDPPDLTHSRIHEVILKTRFFGIVTTNFDMVFEHQDSRLHPILYPRRLHPLAYPQGLSDVVSHNRPGFFAKIHGCVRLTPNLHADLVLTKEDFGKLRADPRYRAIVQNIFMAHTVLTAGYSLRDPDFLEILDDLADIFGSATRTIYSLMRDPGEKQRNKWRKQGVEIIPYDQHGQLVGFFEQLQELSEKTRPILRLTASPLPTKVADVKDIAWKFYSEWRANGTVSPKFGPVAVTMKAWRHITRVSRPQEEICHKLSLLPLARQLLEKATDSQLLRPIEGGELHAVRGVHESQFEAEIVVEVILEVTAERTKLLALHERRTI